MHPPTEPSPSSSPNGKANFAFTYNCHPNRVNGRVYTYHDTSTNGLYPGLKIEGIVTNTLIDADGDPATPEVRPARSCQEIIEAPVAQFEGNYRSLETKYCNHPGGRFNILVFDQGNPSLPAGEFTGDGFSIELSGAPTSSTPGPATSRAATSTRIRATGGNVPLTRICT